MCSSGVVKQNKLYFTLSEQANKALFPIKSLIRQYNISVGDALHIFCKKVVPILTYGSEIWGHSVWELDSDFPTVSL